MKTHNSRSPERRTKAKPPAKRKSRRRAPNTRTRGSPAPSSHVREGESTTEKPAHKLRAHELAGWLLQIVGSILYFLGFVFFFLSLALIMLKVGAIPSAIGFAIAFGSLGAGHWVSKIGQRYRAKAAETIMSQDKRSPVIYLRSFTDDPLLQEHLIFPAAPTPPPSEEEQLARALHPLGPFVAIGKPGETLPQLGAARMYVQDHEWQDKITTLMREAQLVVFLAGFTPGIWWELETALQTADPRRLVILLPFNKTEQYHIFRDALERHLSHPLPEYKVSRKDASTKIRGMVFFGPTWRPHFAEFHKKYIPFFRRGTLLSQKQRIFQHGFRPIFEQLNHTWVQPSVSPLWIGLFATIILLFLGLIFISIF